MKKIIIIILAVSCLFYGCENAKTDDKLKELENVSSYNDISSEIENLDEFDSYFDALKENSLGVYDFENAYNMCVQAITEYQYCKVNKGKMDFSKYIENKDLIKYLETKLEVNKICPQHEVTNTGLMKFSIQEASSTKFSKDRLFLKIAYFTSETQNSGCSSVIDFIVENINGKLVIVEWYDTHKDGFDVTCRGFLDVEKEDIFWKNQQLVDKLKNKVDDYIKNNV